MTEIHARRFSNALANKGFTVEESKHHTMFWLVVGGRRRAIRTQISHGQRKVDDWLLSEIAKDLHLPKRDLLQFIGCKITEQGYVDLMMRLGHLES